MFDDRNLAVIKMFHLISKDDLENQGQVTENGFSELLDLENVRIDSKIECSSRHTAKDMQGHMKNVYDFEFQGQPSRSRDRFQNFFIDHRKCRIDTKINFVSCWQPEI